MTSAGKRTQHREEAASFDLLKRLLGSRHWARAFFERCQPGIFVVEAPAVIEELVAAAREQSLFVARIDVERIANHEAFLAEVARVLNFPEYYGQNWDAFEECIRDLSWLPARGYLLVLAGYDRLARSDPANWAIGLDVLQEAVSTWSRTESPMYVLLQGAKDGAPGVSTLRCVPKARSPKLSDRRVLAKQGSSTTS